MTKTVIINGTNSRTSRVSAIQQYILEELENVKTIEVFSLPAYDLITANFASEEIRKANLAVEQADVVVVLTPIYKAAYSGILKAYLDLIPQKGFENKHIIPIAVGGTQHHLLAIDYALKPVLSALGATSISQGVFILDKQIERKEQGFVIADEIKARLNQQLVLEEVEKILQI
ncbi:MAG: NADPH-dependent FMN reductase [Lysinibacillus sp.]